MLGKLWRSENHEELQSPCKKLCFKDRQQKPKPLGPRHPVPGTYCFAGERVGCQFSGAAAGTWASPPSPRWERAQRNALATCWHRAGPTQLLPAWHLGLPCRSGAARAADGGWVQVGQQRRLPFLSHAVTGASQLLARLGDTALTLHLWVLPQGSVLPLPYPSKPSSFPSASTWHIFGVVLLFLPFWHCVCYSLLIYELLWVFGLTLIKYCEF